MGYIGYIGPGSLHVLPAQESKTRKLVFDGIDAAAKCDWVCEGVQKSAVWGLGFRV